MKELTKIEEGVLLAVYCLSLDMSSSRDVSAGAVWSLLGLKFLYLRQSDMSIHENLRLVGSHRGCCTA